MRHGIGKIPPVFLQANLLPVEFLCFADRRTHTDAHQTETDQIDIFHVIHCCHPRMTVIRKEQGVTGRRLIQRQRDPGPASALSPRQQPPAIFADFQICILCLFRKSMQIRIFLPSLPDAISAGKIREHISHIRLRPDPAGPFRRLRIPPLPHDLLVCHIIMMHFSRAIPGSQRTDSDSGEQVLHRFLFRLFLSLKPQLLYEDPVRFPVSGRNIYGKSILNRLIRRLLSVPGFHALMKLFVCQFDIFCQLLCLFFGQIIPDRPPAPPSPSP